MLKKWFSFIRVSTVQHWKTHVLESPVPVIVHFHSEWSVESNTLKDSLISEYSNTHYNIIEIDPDELTSISKILNIKVSPTVYLIQNSRKIHSFEGKLTQKQKKSLFYDLKLLSGYWSEQDLVCQLINDASDFYSSQKYDESIESYQKALKIESTKEIFEPSLLVGLIRSNFSRGDFESTEFYINQLQTKHAHSLDKNKEISIEINKFLELIGNKRHESKYLDYQAALQSAHKDIHSDPFNNEKHINLALVHYDFGFIEEALNKTLQIIESEGTLTGKGYKLLMELIHDLGHDNIYVKNLQPKIDFIHKKFRNHRNNK
jgi:thioredoxin-like negative regulator of GroEL